MTLARRRERPTVTLAGILVLAAVGSAAPLFLDAYRIDLAVNSAAVLAAARDSYAVSTPITLLNSPRVVLERGSLAILPAESMQPSSGAQTLALLNSGKARLVLRDAVVSVSPPADEKGPAGAAEPDAPRPEEGAPIVKALRRLGFEQLTISNGVLRLPGQSGPLRELNDVDGQLSIASGKSASFDGSFVFEGERATLKATLGLNQEKQPASRRIPIKAEFAAPFIRADVEGRLALVDRTELIAQRAQVQLASVREAARWLGLNWPSGLGFGALEAKGPMIWSGSTIAFENASFTMDGNAATGGLSLTYGGERPLIDGTLALKSLDLTPYFASGDNAENTQTLPGWLALLGVADPSEPLAMPLLQVIDADLRISSDKLLAPGLAVGRNATTISLRGSKLLADIAELELEQPANGGGQLTIDMSGRTPAFALRGKAEQLEFGALAEMIFGYRVISGRGELVADVTAAGTTWEDALSSLAGTIQLTVLEDAEIGVDLAGLADSSRGSPIGSSGWPAAARGSLDVESLGATFQIARGVLFADRARALTADETVEAKGTIDLSAKTIGLTLLIADRLAEASEPATALKRLTPAKVIGLSGPWARPVVRSDASINRASGR